MPKRNLMDLLLFINSFIPTLPVSPMCLLHARQCQDSQVAPSLEKIKPNTILPWDQNWARVGDRVRGAKQGTGLFLRGQRELPRKQII